MPRKAQTLTARFPYVLNVVAGATAVIGDKEINAIYAACNNAVRPGAFDWLAKGRAFDIPFDGEPDAAIAALREAVHDEWLLDINVVPVAKRRKKLFVADMDSTIIGCECIDELADMAHIKPKVAAITERAMRGELEIGRAHV